MCFLIHCIEYLICKYTKISTLYIILGLLKLPISWKSPILMIMMFKGLDCTTTTVLQNLKRLEKNKRV